MPVDDESLRVLRELDEGTSWELPREMSDDGKESDSMAGVSGDVRSEGEDKPWGETIPNILDCLKGLYESGEVVDVVVVANTKDDDQLLFTNLGRNDLIIGRLEIAKMNWFNNELAFLEEEGGE